MDAVFRPFSMAIPPQQLIPSQDLEIEMENDSIFIYLKNQPEHFCQVPSRPENKELFERLKDWGYAIKSES